MTARDARKLAVAILGDEPGSSRRGKDIAGAYLDLLRATEDYWRQSLPYTDDEAAERASEALRPYMQDLGTRP